MSLVCLYCDLPGFVHVLIFLTMYAFLLIVSPSQGFCSLDSLCQPFYYYAYCLCITRHRFEISIVDINTWIYVKVCIDLETFIVDIDTWIYVKIYIGLEIYIIDINTWIYVKFA